MTVPFEPQFLTLAPGPRGSLGQRFVIHHPPAPGPLRGLVVYVHPFAEEMNKSRRMAALQARLLAEQGYAVLQLDLLGCGDSGGDFGDASWALWVDDVVFACDWLRQRYPAGALMTAPPLWLWGLRAGCLLAAAAARHLEPPCHFIFWQPAITGKLLLQQFLRLKAASELLAGHAKATMDQLRSDLAAQRSVEVAGYTLAPALCLGLEEAQLRAPQATTNCHALWFEITTTEARTLSPASMVSATAWRDAGWLVDARAVSGPAFWQTAEIEDAPELLAATTAALIAASSSNPAAPPLALAQT